MAVLFYDNDGAPPAEDGTPVRIDRIYCFELDWLFQTGIRRLGEIFRSLPDYQMELSSGAPSWFGIQGRDTYYMVASIEPPGLQVAGFLQYDQWKLWVGKFEAMVNDLPFREQTDLL